MNHVSEQQHFWNNWEARWNTPFSALYSFLTDHKLSGINEADRIHIIFNAKKLQHYTVMQLWKDRVFIDVGAYNLIKQNIRQYLHTFFCLMEINAASSKSLSTDKVIQLLKCLDHMKDSWDTLKNKSST